MTAYYDADGEPMSSDDLARDVLDHQEYAEYRAAQRMQPRRSQPTPRPGLRVDEYGYDREGRYYPELDGVDPWERAR